MRLLTSLITLCVLFSSHALAITQRDVDTCAGDGRDLTAAVRACSALLDSPTLPPKRRFQVLQKRAKWYHRREKYQSAISDLSAAIKLSPETWSLWQARGFNYFKAGNHAAALSDFNQVLNIDPGVRLAYRTRADVLAEIGSLDRAIADYTIALRLKPEFVGALLGRADVHLLKESYGLARADFERILSISANNTRAEKGLKRVAQAEAAAARIKPAASASSNQSPAIRARKRVALVLGNSNYASVSKLSNPKRDARAIADAFRRLNFSEVDFAYDLSKSELERALLGFSDKAREADWAVVYYAGHGIEVGGVNYLVPVDARLKRAHHVKLEAVSLDSVLEATSAAGTFRLVILDACRDNPFVPRMKTSQSSRSIGRGLARVEPMNGTLVAYAARDGQIALDGNGQNSPYVTALLKHLGEPGLDVRLMFSKVRDTVLGLTANEQQPFTYGSLPGVELSFNPVQRDQ